MSAETVPSYRIDFRRGFAVVPRGAVAWPQVIDVPFDPTGMAVTPDARAECSAGRDRDRGEDRCPHCHRALPSRRRAQPRTGI